jgi:hypothetical protein
MTTAHKMASKHFFEVASEAASKLDKRSLLALTLTIRAHLTLGEKNHEARLRAGAKIRRPSGNALLEQPSEAE